MSKPFQRKHLSVSSEELFLACLHRVGAVDYSQMLRYQGNHWYSSGVKGFLLETVQGKTFVQILTEYGEAKTRAAGWIRKYAIWCAARAKEQA
jgi:hypothetical protein